MNGLQVGKRSVSRMEQQDFNANFCDFILLRVEALMLIRWHSKFN
jgi:hypothetical protein